MKLEESIQQNKINSNNDYNIPTHNNLTNSQNNFLLKNNSNLNILF